MQEYCSVEAFALCMHVFMEGVLMLATFKETLFCMWFLSPPHVFAFCQILTHRTTTCLSSLSALRSSYLQKEDRDLPVFLLCIARITRLLTLLAVGKSVHLSWRQCKLDMLNNQDGHVALWHYAPFNHLQCHHCVLSTNMGEWNHPDVSCCSLGHCGPHCWE